MIPIPITNDMISEAHDRANTIVQHLKSHPNYTQLEQDNRYYIGILGELAVKKLLEDQAIKAEYHIQHNGRSGQHDFILFTPSGKPVTIDIKTASKAWYKKIMMPQAQATHKYDFYIGCRLVSNTCEIWGACAYANFLVDRTLVIPTLYKHLKDLLPIEALLAKCQPGKIETIEHITNHDD